MEGDPALVQDEDGIIKLQVREGMGDGENDAPVFSRKIVQEVDDFPLGARVEAGGDLVAEEDFRIRDEFHRKAETTFLAAGKDFYRAVVDRAQAGFPEDAVDAVVQFLGVL